MCKIIPILGAGPAGSCAAIAARREGSPVRLIEKSKFPRHKVCGEFFSPEIEAELTQLGVWDAFLAAGPTRIRRMKLHFGKREKKSILPEPAWGLSRYAFDALLLARACAAGAEIVRESDLSPIITASGRQPSPSPRGNRLFGFKTHFEGPPDDTVELFFFDRCYVGVNTIEGGFTNVCGLGPEDLFRRFDFNFDAIVQQSPALAEHLRPLRRSMGWLTTGPLQFGQSFSFGETYPAGDALSFVDPFTGTGLVAAVKTGSLAGMAASQGTARSEYLAQCRASLGKPFEIARILRKVLNTGWADALVPVLPSRLLFALTRPK